MHCLVVVRRLVSTSRRLPGKIVETKCYDLDVQDAMIFYTPRGEDRKNALPAQVINVYGDYFQICLQNGETLYVTFTKSLTRRYYHELTMRLIKGEDFTAHTYEPIDPMLAELLMVQLRSLTRKDSDDGMQSVPEAIMIAEEVEPSGTSA